MRVRLAASIGREIAGIGSWELDLATSEYVWSKQLYRIRGLSPDTFRPNRENVAPYVDADDDLNVQAWLTDMAAGIERDARDARIVRPNDEKRVLRVEARPA